MADFQHKNELPENALFCDVADFTAAYLAELATVTTVPAACADSAAGFAALAQLIRNRAVGRAAAAAAQRRQSGARQVYYFSMEFLIGRLLKNYLQNLGVEEIVREGLAALGKDPDELYAMECDPGLGNGGLGRLAACFMDSCATLGLAVNGIGIRYSSGLFRQQIGVSGQHEIPDDWLSFGYPWEICRRADAVEVHFGGAVERLCIDGRLCFREVDYQTVRAVPYDVPMVGAGGTVNTLRLWAAEPLENMPDLAAFNRGDLAAAHRANNEAAAITTLLYADDSHPFGRELRLKQEYFFVSAGLKSIIRQYKAEYGADWAHFADRVAIHTNDTHPALCVPELMHLLLDEEKLGWDEAWDITCRTVSFTNHTVLPEALETWPIDLVQRLLPRVYLIIEEIDRRWRENFPQTECGELMLMRTAPLWGGTVRMANLSVIGSHAVNGVARLHTQILQQDVLRDFYDLAPRKFSNKTNGVCHRRFLLAANPALSRLIDGAIGTGWHQNATMLQELLPYAADSAFLADMAAAKRENKRRLAEYVQKAAGVEINEAIDTDAIFDVQVKRIHAYKRQLLNVFKIIHFYNLIHAGKGDDIPPHCFIFAGKAAAGYTFAKDVIRLIVALARLVNTDPMCRGRMQVVFLENFNVSLGELIYPAADISEQISTAGKEASGTGNMKFMFNGAVTLGTLDGANIEILEQVGRENMQIFGLTADEVARYRGAQAYSAAEECRKDERLQQICSQLINGYLAADGDFRGVYDTLFGSNDEYFVLKDFAAYFDAWCALGQKYTDTTCWRQMSLANTACAGYFSADRTIREYADEIWHL